MRLFITGASGFVGAATLSAALEAGHEVAAPVRPGSPAPRLEDMEGRYRRLPLDLRDTANIAAAMAEFRPDAVFHLAWWGVANSARFDRRQVTDNIETACALTEAAAASGAKAFVGVGSQGEYGADSTMAEDALPRPTSLYGAAKVATLFLTRQLAEQAGLRHAWLRLFSVYGPGDNDAWLIPMLIGEMLGGRRPRTTLGTQYWDWLYVDDVARAILAVAVTPAAAGVFNLGSGHPVQVRSVIERIRDLAAPGMVLRFGEISFRPDQVMHMQADISRLTAATGWTPRVGIRGRLGGHRSLVSGACVMKADWLLILRFLVVGGLNTLFGYISYAAFVLAGAPLGVAVVGSTTLAFIFNFFSYGGMVFGSTSHRLLPRFLVFYCGLGGVNFVLLRTLTYLGLGPLWAQALLLPLLAGTGFLGMRLFVFRVDKPSAEAGGMS